MKKYLWFVIIFPFLISYGLLCDGIPGTEDEVGTFSPTFDGSFKEVIWDAGFSLLYDGIREYLFGHQKGLQGFFQQWHEENNQLLLFDP